MTSVPFNSLDIDIDGSYLIEHTKAEITDPTHKIEITTNSHISPLHGNEPTVYLCQTHLRSGAIGDIEVDLPNALRLLEELEKAVQILEALNPGEDDEDEAIRYALTKTTEPQPTTEKGERRKGAPRRNRHNPLLTAGITVEERAAHLTAWVASKARGMSADDALVMNEWLTRTLTSIRR